MGLEKILRHLKGHRALKVSGLRGEKLHVGKLLESFLETGHSLLIVGRASLSLNDDDVSLAIHLLEQVPGGLHRDGVVIATHERNKFSAVRTIDQVHHGNVRCVELFNPGNHRFRVHWNKDSRAGALCDGVFDLTHLFRNAVVRRRDVVDEIDVQLVRGSLRSNANSLKVGVGLVLGKQRDTFRAYRRSMHPWFRRTLRA